MKERTENKILSFLVIASGIWLVVSPIILKYSFFEAATTNEITIGIVVILLALVTFLRRGTFSWGLIALMGLWEILAPFALNYSESAVAFTNSLVVGIALIVLSGIESFQPEENVPKSFGPSYYSEEKQIKNKEGKA